MIQVVDMSLLLDPFSNVSYYGFHSFSNTRLVKKSFSCPALFSLQGNVNLTQFNKALIISFL